MTGRGITKKNKKEGGGRGRAKRKTQASLGTRRQERKAFLFFPRREKVKKATPQSANSFKQSSAARIHLPKNPPPPVRPSKKERKSPNRSLEAEERTVVFLFFCFFDFVFSDFVLVLFPPTVATECPLPCCLCF